MSIITKDIEKELEDSYVEYAVTTITDRAIADINDGLKPSQRRTLLTFRNDKRWASGPFVKSVKITGRVLADYHPHSDAAAYETMVRMCQPWAMRYPLIDFQGNMGNQSGMPPAASRYTEVKLTKIGEEMLDELEIDGNWTVETGRNFDDSMDEPLVLPSKFPNSIVNGSMGLATGWMSNIPPFNLREMVSGLISLINNPELSVDELLTLIPGPDFPTGGIIHGQKGIRDLYTTGNGHLAVTGRVQIDKNTITVYELPYSVTSTSLKEAADEAFKQGKLTGVSKLTDASSARQGTPVRIIFHLKKGEDPQVVLNQLYAHTPLMQTFAGHMISLLPGKDGSKVPPRNALSLRYLMQAWIDFRKKVIARRTAIRLTAAKRRITQLLGFVIALNNIDEVVSIIKEAVDETEILISFANKFNLSETQTKDILALKIRNLMKLERDSLNKELGAKQALAQEYVSIIGDVKLIQQIITQELLEMKKAYGDDRRTTIEGEIKKRDSGDLVPEEQVIVTLTNTGYIKRSPLESYRKTSRGTKGVIGATTNDDDYIVKVFPASTHDWLLAFTNLGMVHWLKVFDIPESVRVAKGRALVNLIKLQEGEKVTSIIPVSGEFDQREIVFGTALGLVKKTHLAEYGNPRNGGIVAIKLNDDDKLIGATLTDGENQLLLITEGGQAIRVEEAEIASQGRNTAGRRGIKLKIFGDKVCALLCIAKEDQRFVLTFTQEGVGKRTPISEYPAHHCGGSGVITSLVAGPETQIVTAALVNEADEVMIVSDQGKAVRIPVKEIRISDRRTKGVRLIDLDKGQKLVSAAVITKED